MSKQEFASNADMNSDAAVAVNSLVVSTGPEVFKDNGRSGWLGGDHPGAFVRYAKVQAEAGVDRLYY